MICHLNADFAKIVVLARKDLAVRMQWITLKQRLCLPEQSTWHINVNFVGGGMWVDQTRGFYRG